MSQLELDMWQRGGIKRDFSFPFLLDPGVEKGRAYFFKNGGFIERESSTSL